MIVYLPYTRSYQNDNMNKRGGGVLVLGVRGFLGPRSSFTRCPRAAAERPKSDRPVWHVSVHSTSLDHISWPSSPSPTDIVLISGQCVTMEPEFCALNSRFRLYFWQPTYPGVSWMTNPCHRLLPDWLEKCRPVQVRWRQENCAGCVMIVSCSMFYVIIAPRWLFSASERVVDFKQKHQPKRFITWGKEQYLKCFKRLKTAICWWMRAYTWTMDHVENYTRVIATASKVYEVSPCTSVNGRMGVHNEGNTVLPVQPEVRCHLSSCCTLITQHCRWVCTCDYYSYRL